MALDPTEHTVDELREKVKGMDDSEELQAALETERAEKNRKTAKRAFERRIEEIRKRGKLRATAVEDATSASRRLEERLSGD